MNTRRQRQHYVWRKYLEPWTKDDKIWCLRRDGGSPFHTNPVNIAVEHNFYRLTSVTAEDLVFIQEVAIKPTKLEILRKFNQGWVDIFDEFYKLDKYIRNHQRVEQATIEALDRRLNTVEEENYAQLENLRSEYLARLVLGDSRFYEQDSAAAEFSYFLMHQYVRTKKVRNRFLTELSNVVPAETVQRTWPILRHIFAINMAFSVFAARQTLKLLVVESEPDIEFITADQPVMNTYAASSQSGIVDKEEFYYPVSPRRAVILSDRPSYANMHGQTVDASLTSYFNRIVEQSAHEQLFASQRASLEAVEKSFGKMPA